MVRIHDGPIHSSLRAGHLPILTCLGETASGQIVNLGSDTAMRELSIATQPYKMVFLTETGGLLGEDGRVISAVNLAEDYDFLMEQPWVHSGMRAKLQEIKKLLEALPQSSSASITSPDRLAKELFTHTGSGTLVRRGERVNRFETLDGIDRARLAELLEALLRPQAHPRLLRQEGVLPRSTSPRSTARRPSSPARARRCRRTSTSSRSPRRRRARASAARCGSA